MSVGEPYHPAFQRVIVNTQAAEFLNQKYVTETYEIVQNDDGSESRVPPADLFVEQHNATKPVALSKIWADHIHISIGDEASRHPKGLPEATQRVDENTSAQPEAVANHYIEPAKAAQVSAWSQEIDELVDPNTVKPELPAEPSTSRRRVVADSDSEDENIPSKTDQKADTHPNSEEMKPSAPPPGNLPSRARPNDLISVGTAPASTKDLLERSVASGLSIFQNHNIATDGLESGSMVSDLLGGSSVAGGTFSASRQADSQSNERSSGSSTTLQIPRLQKNTVSNNAASTHKLLLHRTSPMLPTLMQVRKPEA
jgi:hypothetical protein